MSDSWIYYEWNGLEKEQPMHWYVTEMLWEEAYFSLHITLCNILQERKNK